MPSYYEMLSVAPTAAADEIKRAFRREIAKYHPDKVQHLGEEFQAIAAGKATELTAAYRTLTDEALRVDYDAQLSGEAPAQGFDVTWAPSKGGASAAPFRRGSSAGLSRRSMRQR